MPRIKKVNMWRAGSRLPSGYQEVEYIESSGTQWIDTGLYWELNKKFILDSKRSSTLSYGLVFGANSNGGEQLYIRDQNRIFLNGSIVYGVSAPSSNVRHIIEWNTTSGNASIKLDGATVASSSGTSSNNRKLTLFGTYETSNAQTPTGYSTKIYSFKGYDVSNNVLLRDFVPCYRTSDGVIGMYDLVGGTFYTNSGSGTFLKGNNVTQYERQIWPKYWNGPTDNTVVYYNIDSNDTSSTIYDKSGNDYHLNGGSFSYSTDELAGRVFNGANYSTIPSRNQINFGQEFTFVAWAKLYNNYTSSTLFANSAGTSNHPSCGLQIMYDTSAPSKSMTVGFASGILNDGISVKCYINPRNYQGLWICIAYTRDSNGAIKFYCNGELLATNVVSQSVTYPGNQFLLGGWRSGDKQPFNGYIKTLIGENISWSQQEIKDYYNNNKSRFGLQ